MQNSAFRIQDSVISYTRTASAMLAAMGIVALPDEPAVAHISQQRCTMLAALGKRMDTRCLLVDGHDISESADGHSFTRLFVVFVAHDALLHDDGNRRGRT